MATLLEFVEVPVDASLFEIETGKEEDSVIITHKKSFINTLKLSDQKLISSVPVKHGLHITSPAVWNKEKNKYFLVQNKQDVRSWKEGAANLDKTKKRSVPTDVHKLFSLTSYEPIILCENGNVGFLSATKELHQNPVLSDGETISWCSALQLLNGACVLYTTTQKYSEKGSLEVHSFWYSAQSDSWHHKKSSVPTHRTLLACACSLGHGLDQVRFFTLWKQGELHELLLGASSDEKRGQPVKVPGVSSQCSMFCLSENHIAIVGQHKSGQDGIGILDTKFGTVQAWQPFPEKLAQEKKAFCQQEHLFVHCGRTLHMCRYECQLSTLAAILGQQQGTLTDEDSGPVPVSLDWKTASDSPSSHDETGSSREVLGVFSNLTDIKKTSSYTAFKREFGILKNKLEEAGMETWACTNAMSLLIQRCCSETKFWPRAELEFLISQRCISASNIGQVFEALLKKEEVGLIHQTLKTGEIPESCLVTALNCFFGASDETLEAAHESVNSDSTSGRIPNGFDETSDPPACKFPKAKLFFVNHVVCFPFTDAYLLESMRKLPFSLVLAFLQYILHMLKEPVRIRTDGSTPSTDQLYNWLAITVDAHNTHLILAKDAHELLVKLREEIDHHVNLCVELGKLEPILNRLKMLKTKSTFTKNKVVGQYCIEMLHLF